MLIFVVLSQSLGKLLRQIIYLNINLVEKTLLLLKILWFSISIFWLLILLKDWLKNRNINAKWIRCGVLFALAIFATTASFLTIATFEVWKNDPIGKSLLPPYNPTYFYGYSFFNFWLIYVFDLEVSLAWTFFLLILYKYSKKNFLDEKEIYLSLFTALIVGWPNFIIYLFVVFGLMALKQIANYCVSREKELIRLAPYMIIGSLVVIALMMKFNDQLGINELKLINRPFFK